MLLILDWPFALETFARVACWSIFVGFFWSIGCAIAGWRPKKG